MTAAVALVIPLGISGAATKKRVTARRKVVVAKKKVTVAPSFSIRVLGDAQTVNAGSMATYPFAVDTTGNFQGSIAFDVPDLPPGVTAAVSARSTTSFDLHVTTTATVAGGSAVYILRGRAGAIDKPALFRLTVNPAAVTTLAAATSVATTIQTGDFSLGADTPSRTVAPGQSTAFSIRVNRSSFSGPVTFKTEGLPAGATATAAPDPTQVGTSLYVATTAATPSGTYLLVVTGSGSGLSRAVAVRLVVRRVGPFTLAVGPAALTVSAGNDAPTSVTVGIPAGTSVYPDVSLDISGAPVGVVVRTPVTEGHFTKFVLSTSADTPAGTYRLAVVGTSGTFTQTAALTLTVTNDPQGFGLSVQPVSLTVSRGSTATFDLTLVRRGGQSAAIVYSVTGLPPSATAAFDPTSATAVTVKITTTAATPPTSYPLLITGRSGTLEATVAVTLVVVAPAA